MDTSVNPPGHPGLEPRWTSSAKAGVGTATDPESRVLLSISHGILDEIYHPFLDHATTRDFGFIVTDDAIFSRRKSGIRNTRFVRSRKACPAIA